MKQPVTSRWINPIRLRMRKAAFRPQGDIWLLLVKPYYYRRGRSVPAAFDRDTGAFRYFHLQTLRTNTSAPFVSIIDDRTFTGQVVYSTQTGEPIANEIPLCNPWRRFQSISSICKATRYAPCPVICFLIEHESVDRKDNPVTRTIINDAAWTIACADVKGVSLIGAGDTIVLGTADQKVLLANTDARGNSIPVLTWTVSPLVLLPVMVDCSSALIPALSIASHPTKTVHQIRTAPIPRTTFYLMKTNTPLPLKKSSRKAK